MRNHVIGTAGHVDHGKTSLVKALTGINTDTLKEEQTRGITVNLGFAFLNVDSHHTVGIVDVPGHERLIKNMLAGVCGMDLILLTVACDDGIMPQTREHMEIIRFLNIENIIVVLTKIDLVTRERIEEVKEAVRDEFNLNKFVEFSIYNNDTTQDVINIISENLKDYDTEINSVFRLPIDRVFNVKGQGVVVTGSSLSGIVRLGDELEILPSKQRVSVRGIQTFNKPVKEAYKRMRVALNLGGVKKEDLNRGDIVATIGALSPSSIIDVKIKAAPKLAQPIRNLEVVKFYYLANEIKCRVKLINCKQINGGETHYGQLLLDEGVYACQKDLGVLRRVNPITTIAGIEIVNVFGEYVNRKDESYQDLLHLYDKNDLDILVRHYVRSHPFVTLGVLKQKMNILNNDNKELIDIVTKDGVVLDDGTCITNEKIELYHDRLINILEKYHAENPHDIGMNRQLCQAALGLEHVPNKAFNQFLMYQDKVKITNDKVRLSSFSIRYNEEEQRVVDSIKNYIDSFDYQPPKLDDILFNVRGKNVKSIYYSLIKEKELILIDQDIVLTKEKYEEMLTKCNDFFKVNPIMKINDGRDLLNTSRKYIVPYLEYLDKVGFTRRVEEGRVKK